MYVCVPVDGDVVLRPVDDVDDERVALPDLQRRPRELPVHRDDVVRVAQPLHRRLLDHGEPNQIDTRSSDEMLQIDNNAH